MTKKHVADNAPAKSTVLTVALVIIIVLAACALLSFKASGISFRASISSLFDDSEKITIYPFGRTVEVLSRNDHDDVVMNISPDAQLDSVKESEQNGLSFSEDIVENVLKTMFSASEASNENQEDSYDDQFDPTDLSHGETYKTEEESLLSSIVVDGMKISFDTPVNERRAKEYALYVRCVPNFFLSPLAEHGWSVRIVDEEIDSMVGDVYKSLTDIPNSDIAGICNGLGRVILVESNAHLGVVVHELGHAVDWECGGLSYESDWVEAERAIVRTNEQNIATRSAYEGITFHYSRRTALCQSICERGYPHERWAEAWECYWRHPGELLQECPEAFYYFAERFGVPDKVSDVPTTEALEEMESIARKVAQNPLSRGWGVGVSDIMEYDEKKTSPSSSDANELLDELKALMESLSEGVQYYAR